MERVASHIINGYADNFHPERVANGVGHQVVVKIISEIIIKSGISLFNHIWPLVQDFLRPIINHFNTIPSTAEVAIVPLREGPTLRPRRRR